MPTIVVNWGRHYALRSRFKLAFALLDAWATED